MSTRQTRSRPLATPGSNGDRPAEPPAPCNEAAEAAVVGAFLNYLNPTVVDAVRAIVGPDDFYKPKHAHIVAAALAVADTGKPTEPRIVSEELSRRKLLDHIGGNAVLIELQGQGAATVAAAEHHARIVKEYALRRRAAHIGHELAEKAKAVELDISVVLAQAQECLGEAAADGHSPLFKRWTMAELLAEDDVFKWLARGLYVDPTYGQIGGELKTLKSYVSGFIQVGLAAGVSIFDHFKVDQPRPVISYAGEGGRVLYRRRLERIARAMGVDLADIPLFPLFDVAPVGSERFRQTLTRDLREVQPGLVALDPWYVYHGAETKAADLHQEGALLSSISAPCMDAGATLSIVNHFNQTGAGVNLKRITMAGSGEWSDSWILLAHREDPDVENGRFRLTMDVGSRQWGGARWDLDLDVGRFDEDLGTHDGDITWELRRAKSTGRATGWAPSDGRAVTWKPEFLDQVLAAVDAGTSRSPRGANWRGLSGRKLAEELRRAHVGFNDKALGPACLQLVDDHQLVLTEVGRGDYWRRPPLQQAMEYQP